MVFLSSQGIVHRDLALRNVLVFEAAPAVLVKIADFGLSRVVSQADDMYYRSRSTDNLPFRYVHRWESGLGLQRQRGLALCAIAALARAGGWLQSPFEIRNTAWKAMCGS
jgi:serine/threonine protein kinase